MKLVIGYKFVVFKSLIVLRVRREIVQNFFGGWKTSASKTIFS